MPEYWRFSSGHLRELGHQIQKTFSNKRNWCQISVLSPVQNSAGVLVVGYAVSTVDQGARFSTATFMEVLLL